MVGLPGEAPDLPISRGQITRSAGVDDRWSGAPSALRDAVVNRGFAVIPASRPSVRLGEFYASLRDDGIPSIVTLDALFFLTHLAIDRAFADVDAYVVAPLTATMLHHLDARLGVESRIASADMVMPYLVARVLVEVALALAEPTYEAAPGIARLVAEEKARALAHLGISVSPVFGEPIDYTATSPVGMADRDATQAGWFRSLAWLANASLGFAGVGEHNPSGPIDVGMARVHARAAMILTRLLDYAVDAEAAAAWEGIERVGELMIGSAGDVTRRDISAASARAGLDLGNGDWMSNVVRVDGVRHALAQAREGAVFHLLGPRSVPDGDTLQSLTFPARRALPTALDVAAWLGSEEARAALHDSAGEAHAQYDDTLERLMHARPIDASLASPDGHRTSYLSMIDAIESWLLPSRGDSVQPSASSSDWRKRKAEVAMAAWTELRHDATALTRIPVTQLKLRPQDTATITGPMFVEPHPEAIAKLAGVVRQTERALVAEGMLRSGSSALSVLAEVDDLLWMALGVAVYETADEPLPPLLETSLARFPARMRALEIALEGTGAADVPLVVDVHVDLPSGRVLEETTGRIEEMWAVMREPRSHVLWLAIGASIPHNELTQPAAHRSSDSVWRARLQTEGDPPAEVLARAYVTALDASTRQVSPNSWPR